MVTWKIPYFRHDLGKPELDRLAQVLQGDILTTGAEVAEFETRFAAYLGQRHAFGVTSCTGALHLALLALDIGPGDEVITTPDELRRHGDRHPRGRGDAGVRRRRGRYRQPRCRARRGRHHAQDPGHHARASLRPDVRHARAQGHRGPKHRPAPDRGCSPLHRRRARRRAARRPVGRGLFQLLRHQEPDLRRGRRHHGQRRQARRAARAIAPARHDAHGPRERARGLPALGHGADGLEVQHEQRRGGAAAAAVRAHGGQARASPRAGRALRAGVRGHGGHQAAARATRSACMPGTSTRCGARAAPATT